MATAENGGDVVQATVLTPGRSASVTLSPGRTTYFTLDVALPSAGERATVHLRLQREGGDPVLMASVGQWPVVDLDAQEDMVRAHVCAFDAFHADAEVHALVVHDATAPREQHASIGGGAVIRGGSAKDPRLLAVRSPPNAVRWAIGVHNVSLVKQEPCSFTLGASITAGKLASNASSRLVLSSDRSKRAADAPSSVPTAADRGLPLSPQKRAPPPSGSHRGVGDDGIDAEEDATGNQAQSSLSAADEPSEASAAAEELAAALASINTWGARTPSRGVAPDAFAAVSKSASVSHPRQLGAPQPTTGSRAPKGSKLSRPQAQPLPNELPLGTEWAFGPDTLADVAPPASSAAPPWPRSMGAEAQPRRWVEEQGGGTMGAALAPRGHVAKAAQAQVQAEPISRAEVQARRRAEEAEAIVQAAQQRVDAPQRPALANRLHASSAAPKSAGAMVTSGCALTGPVGAASSSGSGGGSGGSSGGSGSGSGSSSSGSSGSGSGGSSAPAPGAAPAPACAAPRSRA